MDGRRNVYQTPDQGLMGFRGDELKMGIPENSRIREQKQVFTQ